jgi:hypothetical protein
MANDCCENMTAKLSPIIAVNVFKLKDKFMLFSVF